MLILRKYIFEMDSVKFGRLRVQTLTVGSINELVKRLPDYQERSGRDITVISSSVLSVDDKDKAIDGAQLSDQELTEFAEQFLTSHPRLMKVNGVEINKISRLEGESSVDYCGRVIADEIRSYHDRDATLMDKYGAIGAFKELSRMTDMLKDNSRLTAFSAFATASDNIRLAAQEVERFSALNHYKMVDQQDIGRRYSDISETMAKLPAVPAHVSPRIERMKISMPPPNPVYKTNEKLEDLAEQVEVFTGTLTEHLTASVVALNDVAEQLEKGTKSTARQNNIMIGLTVLSAFIAIVATYFGYLGYTAGRAANEKSTQPTAIIAPANAKSRVVSAAKMTSTVISKKSITNNSHGNGNN